MQHSEIILGLRRNVDVDIWEYAILNENIWYEQHQKAS